VLGYFVEVTAQHGDKLMAPPHNAAFIHRQTLAGQVRFTTAELGELETKIAALETQQKELAAALEDPATYQPGGSATTINRDLSALTHDLARLTAEWESVTAAVSAS